MIRVSEWIGRGGGLEGGVWVIFMEFVDLIWVSLIW